MNLLPFLAFKVVYLLFFYVFSLLAIASAHAVSFTQEELRWIEQNPSIILGSDNAWPPYDFVDEQQQHAGISADIIEVIRQKTGLDIRIKSGVWSDVMADMKTGQLDGLVCAVKTPEREAYLNFTPPYATMPLAILVNTDNHSVKRLDDLTNRLVAVNNGSYLHEWLARNHPNISLYLTKSNQLALEAVSFGQADAYVGNLAVATYMIKQTYLTNLKVVAKVHGLDTKTAIAIDKKQPILMSIIQKALSTIDLEQKRLINKKWYDAAQPAPSVMAQKIVRLTAQEQAWMHSYGPIKVAAESDWPPFNSVDVSAFSQNNSPPPQSAVGLSIDVLKLVAQKTGLQLNITADSWENNLTKLEAKQTDLLPAGVHTEERARFASFSSPYFEAHNYFFIRDDLPAESLKDLDGKVVAVPKGFAAIAFLKKNYPNITVYESTSMQDSVEAVIQNKAQILYGFYPVVSYLLRKTGVNSIKPFKTTQEGGRQLRFLLRKDVPELQSIVNKGLAAISEEEKASIELKWYAKSYQNQVQKVLLTPQEKAWIKANKKVKVSSEFDLPPFDFVDRNQNSVGLSLDYLALIGQKTGLNFEITAGLWEKNLNDLKNRQTDLLPATLKTEARTEYSLFSEPYFKIRDYFFIREDLGVETLSDLNGKTVAIPKGYAQIKTLQKDYPDIHILETNSMQEAIEAVIQNRAQLLYEIYPVLVYSLKEAGINTIVPFKAAHQKKLQNLYFMVREDAPELQSIINKGLAVISEEEKASIELKWYATSVLKQIKSVTLTKEERTWMRSHGVVNVVSTRNWPPFNFMDDSKALVGFSLDYLALAAQKTGLKLNVTADDWTQNLSNLEHKKIDLLPAAGKNKDRERYAIFSDPYFNAQDYFFIQDDLDVEHLSDLDGKIVALPKGYASISIIQRNYPNIVILETASIQASIEAVLQNKAQLLYGLYPSIAYQLRKLGVNSIMPFKSTQGSQNLHFMIRDDASELVSILNKGLAAITLEERAKMNRSWLSKQPSDTNDFELSALEKEWLQQNKTVLFSGDPDWLPFEQFTEEGLYIGIVSSFLKEVENKMPLSFKPVPVASWKDTLQLADEQKVMVISGDIDDTHLAQNYHPIDSYFTTPIVIVMNDKAGFVNSLDELEQKSLAIVEGYGYTYVLLKQYPNHNFTLYDTPLEALESVSLNRNDAVLLSFPVASYLMTKHGFQHLNIAGKTALTMNLTLFVSKDQPILHQLLNRAMKEVSEEKGGGILSSWIKLNFASKVDYWFIFQIILAALFVISIVFYWNLKLSKEIKHRKVVEKELKLEKEKLEQNDEQMKLLIDSIPLIVIVTTMDGKILNANRKAIENYQVSSKEVSTLNVADFYQNTRDREVVLRLLQQEGRVDQKMVAMKNAQGQARDMMMSVIPIQYDDQTAFLSILVDLTERILAEKQLKNAMDHAEAANRSKTEFLSNMSHEIRTPMNAILGFTELLSDQVKEPRLKSFISTIQSAGNTLLMLINDILDLSKIEAGKMSLNEMAINPHDVFKEVGDIFTINIQNKGLDFYIKISPDLPEALLLDPIRLRQVLFNLLGNAVKFTETGFIKLSVKPINVMSDLSQLDLLITVEDSGIGVPLDQQDSIFNVFEQQAGQDSGKFGGTGLGLSITKRLVSMMNGNISLTSTPNQGSTFSILLEKVEMVSVHAQDLLEASLIFNAKTIQFNPATILVVDDVLDNRELIVQNFGDSDITVIQAENGEEAIEQYKTNAIDLILMDIRMPVLNGYEAAKAIKVLNPNLPIIALTASVMQDEFEKIKRDYFDDFLRKPVLRSDLIQTLTHFLEYRDVEPKTSLVTEDAFGLDAQSFSESLKVALDDELSLLYQNAVKSNSIEDIRCFAETAVNIARKHEHIGLDQFASLLLEKVDSFDIAGMQFLLKKYDSIF